MAFLAIGLGNPGPRYAGTRHNVGFRVIERAAATLGVQLKKPLFRRYLLGSGEYRDQIVTLAEPLTFMNRSGEVVASLIRKARASAGDMLVVCDTLDLPPGALRLKRGGGSAGHNGLKSIMQLNGGGDFMRLYFGIGHPGVREEVVDYVLGEPPEEEASAYEEATEEAVRAILELSVSSPEKVMNELNRKKRS